MSNPKPSTADERARNAARSRAEYQRRKVNPDLALRAEVSTLKTIAKRVARRLTASPPPPLHPADAAIAADAIRTLTNDANLLSSLVHPSRRIAR